MFVLNDDLSIYATRGDIVFFSVQANEDGEIHKFQPGDVVRIKIYGRKDASTVVLEKDFPVMVETESVEIFLDSEDTKIGGVISKPKDYWYEVELNPLSNPQTLIGYDEDGAKIFKLFPEGADLIPFLPDAEDVPFIDKELDLTSPRPVENQAVARAIVQLKAAFDDTKADIAKKSDNTEKAVIENNKALAVERARIDNLVSGATADDAELIDIRVGADGKTHSSAGEAVRKQVAEIHSIFSGKGITLTSSDFESGSWKVGEGGFYNTPLRIRCALPINRGDVISVNPNGQYITAIIIGEKASTTILATKDYTKNAFEMGCSYDGYVVFLVAKEIASAINITPEELAAQVTIHRVYSWRGNMIYPIKYETGNIYMTDDGFNYDGATTRVRTPKGYSVPLAKGDIIRLKDYTDARFYVGWINPDGTYGRKGWLTSDFACPVNAEYVILVCNKVDTDVPSAETLGGLIEVHTRISNELIARLVSADEWQTRELGILSKSNCNIRSINHRGYSKAPENTLSAYRLSKKNGFTHVECDVSFTSDGYAVLLHDGTVDRTSDGTGNIADLTLAEVRALDFGSWKSAEYAGEKIPTFEEFINLCKCLGLHPYIELKTGTEEQIKSLVNIVKRYGMKGKVTWISFSAAYLGYVKAVDNKARLGYVVNEVNNTIISTIKQSLLSEHNEVFVNCGFTNATGNAVQLCADADIPLEVWTVNKETSILSLDPYISGVSSDNIVAGKVLYETGINE